MDFLLPLFVVPTELVDVVAPLPIELPDGVPELEAADPVEATEAADGGWGGPPFGE